MMPPPVRRFGAVIMLMTVAVVAGSPDKACPRTEFLAPDKAFGNFELECRMDGTAGCNPGVQFRSRRVPNHHELSGSQADIAPGITAGRDDESRRNRMLGLPPQTQQDKPLALSVDGWHGVARSSHSCTCSPPTARCPGGSPPA